MTLYLYHHPFSSYCQKVLIALEERGVAYQPHRIDLGDERSRAELAAVWPFAKFPVLHDTDNGQTLPESSVIVEYIDQVGTVGERLVPADSAASRGVRLWDRLIDHYLLDPVTTIVTDRLRGPEDRDRIGVEKARGQIPMMYDMLERVVSDTWLVGPVFTLADCAAAPALFYAAKLHPLGSAHPRLQAYLDRLLARPSVARAIDGARPFRSNFPGAEGDGPWVDEQDRVSF